MSNAFTRIPFIKTVKQVILPKKEETNEQRKKTAGRRGTVSTQNRPKGRRKTNNL